MDVIQRLEPVIIEIERERECVVVVAHQAVLRALYGYFTKIPLAVRGGPSLHAGCMDRMHLAPRQRLATRLPVQEATLLGTLHATCGPAVLLAGIPCPPRGSQGAPDHTSIPTFHLRQALSAASPHGDAHARALQDIPRLEIPLHTLIELVPTPDGRMAEERIPFAIRRSMDVPAPNQLAMDRQFSEMITLSVNRDGA